MIKVISILNRLVWGLVTGFLLSFSLESSAYEVSSMAGAQDAVRSICGCVVGNQALSPNCGALSASALQTQNPYGTQMGMPGMNGQLMPGSMMPQGGMHNPMQPMPQMPMQNGAPPQFFPQR